MDYFCFVILGFGRVNSAVIKTYQNKYGVI